MIKFILLAFSMVLLFNIVFFAKLTEREDLYNICKVYYKHGQPRFIEVDGKEYDVNNFSEIDRLKLNPWVAEFMAHTKASDCLQIKE